MVLIDFSCHLNDNYVSLISTTLFIRNHYLYILNINYSQSYHNNKIFIRKNGERGNGVHRLTEGISE
jgi:hypothetical protein